MIIPYIKYSHVRYVRSVKYLLAMLLKYCRTINTQNHKHTHTQAFTYKIYFFSIYADDKVVRLWIFRWTHNISYAILSIDVFILRTSFFYIAAESEEKKSLVTINKRKQHGYYLNANINDVFLTVHQCPYPRAYEKCPKAYDD